MHGDFTRTSFRPAKQYTRVLKQQGRVDVDADWNEQNAIAEHLDRVTRIDVIGRVGVAQDPPFTITWAAGNLTLAPGHFYIDGIFVNYPGAVIPLPAAPGTKDLLFFDVWDRHITAIEDPEIREVALLGPDTCTRVKTEHRVRITNNIGAATCVNAPLPAQSAGTLTADTVPTPPSEECAIAVAGGFSGLENRLYRVEIHTPGALGTATFKWSRDNGSIVFSVVEFPVSTPDRIRLRRLGRDQVLTYRRGDWVEILSDTNDLDGTPGAMHRVVDLDETRQELQLAPNVVPIAQNLNPKVRRWDHISTTPAVPTASGPITLEDGIRVSFAGPATADDFHTGDYWMFPARTATGQIENLTGAPKEGIYHHYAALATITWPAGPGNPAIEICIPDFPSLTGLEGDCCCCTATVGTGGEFTTMQQALNALVAAPQIVLCLLPGDFNLTQPVDINRNNVTIRGCRNLTPINAPAGQPAFRIGANSNIRIESVVINGGGQWSLFNAANFFTLVDSIVNRGGIWIADGASEVVIRNNGIFDSDGPGIALGGLPTGGVRGILLSANVFIENNRIARTQDPGICSAIQVDAAGSPTTGVIFNLRIHDNLIEQTAQVPPRAPFFYPTTVITAGISLGGVVGVYIRGNTVQMSGSATNPATGVSVVFCVAVEMFDNYIHANGTSNPGRVEQCINFATMTPGTVLPNPFVHPLATIFKDPPAAAPIIIQNVIITAQGGFVGLDAGGLGNGAGLTITPSRPTISIRVAIANPPSPVAVRTVLLRAFVGAAQVFSEVLNASNTEIVRVINTPGVTRITMAPSIPGAVLRSLCFTFIDVPATSFQSGVFAMGTLDDPFTHRAALRIHDNHVEAPAGPSLAIASTGAVSVQNNTLRSQEGRIQPGAVAEGLALMVTVLFGSTDLPVDRRLLFSGNQIFSNVNQFVFAFSPNFQGPAVGGQADESRTRCWFYSQFDIALLGNQFYAPTGQTMLTHVKVGFTGNTGATSPRSVRAGGNGIFDLRDTLGFQGYANSMIATNNHSDHFFFATGATPAKTVATGNLIP